MAEHPNATKGREIYEILAHGTMEKTRALLAPDVVWTVPGRGKYAGPKHGIGEVFAFFEQVGWEASSATFTIELRDVVADEHHVVAFVHYHHERPDRIFDQDGVESLTLDDSGRISAFSAFIRDSAAFDEFFA
jgi:ketosteroid isomerase-like protein